MEFVECVDRCCICRLSLRYSSRLLVAPAEGGIPSDIALGVCEAPLFKSLKPDITFSRTLGKGIMVFIGCAVVVCVLGVRAVFISPLPGGKDLFEGNWWHLKCLVWTEFIPRPVLGYPGGKRQAVASGCGRWRIGWPFNKGVGQPLPPLPTVAGVCLRWTEGVCLCNWN